MQLTMQADTDGGGTIEYAVFAAVFATAAVVFVVVAVFFVVNCAYCSGGKFCWRWRC